jgi:hypothetical protein
VLGRGVILEVQYKHHMKDPQGTTHDYLSAGYSVAWLDANEFAPDHLDYAVVDEKFRGDNATGYTVRDNEPRKFDSSGRSTFDWEENNRGCWYYRDYDTHAWFRVSSYVHPQGREYEACRYFDAAGSTITSLRGTSTTMMACSLLSPTSKISGMHTSRCPAMGSHLRNR